MELNYSLKLAESALNDIAPDTCKYVKQVLTSRAGIDDKSSVLAITRILEILKASNNNYVKTRRRRLTKNIIVCLKNLIDLGGYDKPIHRSLFINSLGSNDFSILKYWGFIEPGIIKGTWMATERGVGFCLGTPGSRYANKYVIQLGVKKGNYRIDAESEPVTFEEIMGE